MRNTPREELWDKWPEFRNKSILLAGDSVGRHLFETLCQDYFQSKIVNEDPPDFKNHYGWTSTCVQEDLGLKIGMVHIYGMANTSDPEVNKVLDKTYTGKDWDLQSRITRWWNTTMADFTPDYVQLNSGAWEYRVSRRQGWERQGGVCQRGSARRSERAGGGNLAVGVVEGTAAEAG